MEGGKKAKREERKGKVVMFLSNCTLIVENFTQWKLGSSSKLQIIYFSHPRNWNEILEYLMPPIHSSSPFSLAKRPQFSGQLKKKAPFPFFFFFTRWEIVTDFAPSFFLSFRWEEEGGRKLLAPVAGNFSFSVT